MWHSCVVSKNKPSLYSLSHIFHCFLLLGYHVIIICFVNWLRTILLLPYSLPKYFTRSTYILFFLMQKCFHVSHYTRESSNIHSCLNYLSPSIKNECWARRLIVIQLHAYSLVTRFHMHDDNMITATCKISFFDLFYQCKEDTECAYIPPKSTRLLLSSHCTCSF